MISPRRVARLWMLARLADAERGWNGVNPQIAVDIGVVPVAFDFSGVLSPNVRASYIGTFEGAKASASTDAAMLALHTGEAVNTRRVKFSPWAGVVEGVIKFFIDHDGDGMEDDTESELEAVDATMITVFNRSDIYLDDAVEYNLAMASTVEPVVQIGDGYRMGITFSLEIGVKL